MGALSDLRWQDLPPVIGGVVATILLLYCMGLTAWSINDWRIRRRRQKQWAKEWTEQFERERRVHQNTWGDE